MSAAHLSAEQQRVVGMAMDTPFSGDDAAAVDYSLDQLLYGATPELDPTRAARESGDVAFLIDALKIRLRKRGIVITAAPTSSTPRTWSDS